MHELDWDNLLAPPQAFVDLEKNCCKSTVLLLAFNWHHQKTDVHCHLELLIFFHQPILLMKSLKLFLLLNSKLAETLIHSVFQTTF